MDIDRNDEQDTDLDSSKAPCPEPENKKNKTEKGPHITEVENAHASGLGSMGRSDEKIKDKDKAGGEGKVVY